MDQNKKEINIPNKMFFKIGEVSELTDIPPYVLRYWQAEFNLLRPIKNRIGQRIYRKKDVELVAEIKKLLYQERYTIAGVKQKLIKGKRNNGKNSGKDKGNANSHHLINKDSLKTETSKNNSEKYATILKRHKNELIELMGLLKGSSR